MWRDHDPTQLTAGHNRAAITRQQNLLQARADNPTLLDTTAFDSSDPLPARIGTAPFLVGARNPRFTRPVDEDTPCRKTKHDVFPSLTPLRRLLQSRRVLVALAALIGRHSGSGFPELEAVRGEFLTLVMTLALALIGGYSVEDAATAARQTHSSEALREQVKDVLNSIVDEWLARTRTLVVGRMVMGHLN